MNEQPTSGSGQPTPAIRAAEYVRMSTEHQQYSTENQADVIRQYAERRGMEIVRTYADSGKSGLRIDGRDALKQLIDDVESGQADFEAILVYDVSRWGRFQDADESAYYEYICRRAGIGVHYCAEQFENDGSPVSTIVKGVKRAMAGEYSRELSAKVFTGQCRLIELGYRQGGPPGFGLRRMLLDQAGTPKGVLTRGEQKSLQTDRVVLVPGPPEEVEVVRWIYRMFVEEGRSKREIAGRLNAEGILTRPRPGVDPRHGPPGLTNEKYIGNNVYNRVSFKLKKKRVVNPPEMWIQRRRRLRGDRRPELFYAARGSSANGTAALRRRTAGPPEALFEKEGRLSGILIDETEECHRALPTATASEPGPRLRADRLHAGPRLRASSRSTGACGRCTRKSWPR